jgi:hypothetical protein
MNYNPEQQYQLYAPSVSTMRKNLFCIGSSIDTACCELSRDLSLDKLDRLTAQLNSAQTSLQHLRKAMIAEQGGVQRGGTG